MLLQPELQRWAVASVTVGHFLLDLDTLKSTIMTKRDFFLIGITASPRFLIITTLFSNNIRLLSARAAAKDDA